jgi:hypothetical protein
MDEVMEILRGMRMDADQAIQLLTLGQHTIEDEGTQTLDSIH